MVFYCKCGHPRGCHDDAPKTTDEVKGCNAIISIQGGSIKCTCPRYTPDKQKNKRDYETVFFYKFIIWALVSLFFVIGLQQLEPSTASAILGLEILVGMLVSVYYWILKPHAKLYEKEKIEK